MNDWVCTYGCLEVNFIWSAHWGCTYEERLTPDRPSVNRVLAYLLIALIRSYLSDSPAIWTHEIIQVFDLDYIIPNDRKKGK